MKRIFVAIDSSTTAQLAVDTAISLMNSQAATLCIAHAMDEGPLTQHGMGLGTYIDIDKVKAQMRANAEELVQQAVAKVAAAGYTAEHMLIESSSRRIAEMIFDAATHWQADLIVVGAHGRRGIDRLLVGSVAENLLRISDISLLLVRDRKV